MKLSKILVILFIIIQIQPLNVFAENEDCEQKEGFEVYNCRVKNICSQYKSDKPAYNTKNTYEEPKSLSALKKAKEIYRENIGNIFKCNLIQSQQNALKNIIEKVIKTDSSGKLDEYMGKKIKARKQSLNNASAKLQCSHTETKEIQNKYKLLKEASYEMCKYINYLEYLKIYAKDIGNITKEETQDKFNNTYISKKMLNSILEIEEEINHTYEIFPLAFHAYSDYENLFPVHFLLEIIKEDFKIFRKSIYGTLMPIAQVGYKIINAMSY